MVQILKEQILTLSKRARHIFFLPIRHESARSDYIRTRLHIKKIQFSFIRITRKKLLQIPGGSYIYAPVIIMRTQQPRAFNTRVARSRVGDTKGARRPLIAHFAASQKPYSAAAASSLYLRSRAGVAHSFESPDRPVIGIEHASFTGRGDFRR